METIAVQSKRTPRELQLPGGSFRLLLSSDPVQPFANVMTYHVGNHIHHNGKQKSGDYSHVITSLHCGGLTATLFYLFLPKKYRNKSDIFLVRISLRINKKILDFLDAMV